MNSQNYANHRHFIPFYHFFILPLSLFLFIGTIVNLVKSSHENLYNASLLVLCSFIVIIVVVFSRKYALKAQDRVIRVEENFRHFVLTGKQLDSKLSIRQIIGLRFASDKEMPELAKKAVTENLSENAIKKLIKDWKADTYRV